MMNILLMIVIVLVSIVLILLIMLFLSKPKGNEILTLQTKFEVFNKNQNRLEDSIREEMYREREAASKNLKLLREELNNSLNKFSDTTLSQMGNIARLQKDQLDIFSNNLNKLTNKVEEKLTFIQQDNNTKLEQMRVTVDEKLHETLERRLGESFKLVSERLEQVHKGLGEMQVLASGVGDLKNILTNVKTRGIWGEIQLGNILEQILTKEQYETNVITRKGSNDRVEFALKLPGREIDNDKFVWLPIDSKFPIEDYQRLLDAQERGDLSGAQEFGKQLEQRVKVFAKDIKEKYIDPPNTTDFGIMFLPIEGLFAEVIRRNGLCEKLQNDYKIVVTGPTTLVALLNSLQVGFRTLAIEKRSSQVWEVLGTVKTEFGKFGDILEKTQKKLQEASNTIETAARKSRTIERKLKNVEAISLKKDDEAPNEDDADILKDKDEEFDEIKNLGNDL
jgi:DNA recombination protein RmuC